MIKKLLLGLALAFFALSPQVAFASSADPVVPGYWSISGCPGGINPCWWPSTTTIPLGFQQMTSLGSAASLPSIPASATQVSIECTGQTVMWRDDGTAPTATVGMPLPINTLFHYAGTLSALQLIQTSATATCDVSYYK